MEKKKTSSGRRILNVILLLCNLACLIWIFLSWRGEQDRKPKTALDYYRSRGYDVSEFENTEDDGPFRP